MRRLGPAAAGPPARCAGALESTDLPLLSTRIPMSRRVPTSTLAKLPVVLASPTSPVALAYLALADEVLAAAERAPA